ncbi:carboxypeptidase-like regulatory domain-containing protein [Aquimarina brevivitae]|uniref:Carboxypeptidase-like protein n=1 Tax=Aquimarina brevivitae TaxID=323412 RepID=A0A4Q7PEX9_9FLAO|nr:carboxypeptidase-like regulatory domain-containing protein [Aquimarina brevivitae]RZS98994.1 carboxypeptidase-like protein [Aquimarina brevivitae]
MRLRSYLILLILPLFGYSQSNQLLKGKVMFQTECLEGIHVLNATTGKGVVTDAKGQFMIKVNENDTLVVSSIQFKVKEYAVSTIDISTCKELVFYLEDVINELETVNLRQHALSGSLTADLEQIPTFEDKLPIYKAKDVMGLPLHMDEKDRISTIKNNALRDHIGGATMSIDFSMLFRLTGKLFKKKKNTVTIKKNVAEILTIQVFNNIGLLPEKEYHNFISYLKERPETAVAITTQDELAVLDYLINQSLQYKNRMETN